jgi:hypothetical protein
MKYKIHYKANDKIENTPIKEDIEKNSVISSELKKLMIALIDDFKKLDYVYFYGRSINKIDSTDFLNNAHFVLNKKYFNLNNLHLTIFYDKREGNITKHYAYKENKEKYVPFTKEELKLLDIYNFELPPYFIEATDQNITDWLYMT